MTSIGDLYRHIIYTDDTCVNYLKQKGVLPKQEFCEKINNVSNEMRGGVLKECYKNSRKRTKMGGVGFVVQIDKSLFQGQRKYNRGRLRLGYRQPREEIVESGSI